MGILLGFSPFIAFALVERLLGPTSGLAAGAAMSLGLLLRDRLRGDRDLNLLEAGSAFLFTLLTVIALTGDASAWTVWRVRLSVDLGLLLIVLFSLGIGRPFTLHEARRRLAPEVASSPAFLRGNFVLSSVWAGAFAVLTAVDAWMVLHPDASAALAVGLTLTALAAAFIYTWLLATGRR